MAAPTELTSALASAQTVAEAKLPSETTEEEAEITPQPLVPLLALPTTTPPVAAPQPATGQGASVGSAELADPVGELALALPGAEAKPEQALRGLETQSAKQDKLLEGAAPKSEASTPPRPNLPLPREERAADILQQMRVNLNASSRSAVIQLSPPELGLVTIQIKMEEDKLRTLVRAERPETLDALARHLPELRATLQQQGLQTNDIQLELGLGSRDQAREEAFAQSTRRRPRASSMSEISAGEEALLARILAPQTDGIDLYA